MYIKLNNTESSTEIINNNKSNYWFDSENLFTNEIEILGEFKQINFFIGSNNSGKSRFLRGLLKISNNEIQILKDKIEIEKIVKSSDIFKIERNFNLLNNLQFGNTYLKSLMNISREIVQETLNSFDLINNYNNYKEVFENNLHLKSILTKNNSEPHNRIYDSLIEFINKLQELNESIIFSKNNQVKKKIYIPILRTIKKSPSLPETSYEGMVNELYKINVDSIFSGLRLYDEILKIRNSLKEQREGFEKFEKFLSTHFFYDKSVEIIADYNEKHLVFYIDGEERKIHDIGDGVQQLILMLFPIFTTIENTWIFIEEPETHLHPGLQRIFIETLLNNDYLKSKNLTYFFTSHSNHFLDISLISDKISVFHFEKESTNRYNIKNAKPSQETLDLLGVNTSSVLIANTSIWVEGPTDRKYISKFLKLYCEEKKKKHLKEDIDFAFFEYGGSLIYHYLFDDDFNEFYSDNEVRDQINSFSLSNRIYLLADNDNARGKKLQRKKDLESISNQNFFYQNTKYKEIENLLPLSIIKDFMKQLINIEDVNKIDELKFNRREYISEGLGDFIERLFIKNDIKKFKKFKAESGTLKSSYKIQLADVVVNGSFKFQDLIIENKELENIIENLYKFIIKKNETN